MLGEQQELSPMFMAPWHITKIHKSNHATTGGVDLLHHHLCIVLGHGALLAVPQETVTESISINF